MQARYERHLEGYALALFDVDRFKSFNDSHGHAIGDTMLQTIGKAASAVGCMGLRVAVADLARKYNVSFASWRSGLRD